MGEFTFFSALSVHYYYERELDVLLAHGENLILGVKILKLERIYEIVLSYFMICSFTIVPLNNCFQVQPRDRENHVSLDHPLFPVKLKSFVELTMDFASASPRRYFFEVL